MGLSYLQLGLLLSLSYIVANLVEPILGILGDVWKRRILILGGGLAFALALLFIALSQSFLPLLISFMLLVQASGALVGLSQAALMDTDTSRHEQNMARWVFAGSIGAVAGPLALGAALLLGFGWRELSLAFAAILVALLGFAWRFPFTKSNSPAADEKLDISTLKTGLLNALKALKRGDVLRWLILLLFSDLMLDSLYSLLALYFVDIIGVTEAQASLAVAVWISMRLLGGVLIIPLLEHIRGLHYLRFSAAIKLILFPAFLLIPDVSVKLVTLGLLGLFSAGWYSILQGQLYSTMPGQGGTVLAVGSIFGLVGCLIPLTLGAIAKQYGLEVAMWLLLLGPVALLIGIPRRPTHHDS